MLNLSSYRYVTFNTVLPHPLKCYFFAAKNDFNPVTLQRTSDKNTILNQSRFQLVTRATGRVVHEPMFTCSETQFIVSKSVLVTVPAKERGEIK